MVIVTLTVFALIHLANEAHNFFEFVHLEHTMTLWHSVLTMLMAMAYVWTWYFVTHHIWEEEWGIFKY